MKAIKTIVVGVDFSEASLAALREAVRLAAREGGRVIAVEVVEKDVLADQIHHHKIAAEQAMERIHSNLIKHLAANGADSGVEARIILGTPYSALCEVAESCRADMLALGSRGWDHSPGKVGTVAARCVRRAPLPVLLVRRRQQGAFKRVVACTDYSEPAALALAHAAAIARGEGALLDIVHVDYPVWLQPVHVQYELLRAPGQDYQEQYRAAVRGRLEAHVAGIIPDPPEDWSLQVLENASAAEAIAGHLKEVGADLVVLGTSGRSGFNALFLGTTAERLIHRTECSVLAVKVPSA